jgi:hypothetical protein
LLEEEAIAAGRRVEVTDPAENATRRLLVLMVARLDVLGEGGPAPCEVRGEDAPSDDEVLAELVSLRHGGWVRGQLWFSWERLWQDIGRAYLIERDGPSKVARVIPEIIGHKLEPQRFQRKGTRATLRSLNPHEMELLRTFAAGGATAASVNVCGGDDVSPGVRKGVAGVAAEEKA